MLILFILVTLQNTYTYLFIVVRLKLKHACRIIWKLETNFSIFLFFSFFFFFFFFFFFSLVIDLHNDFILLQL
jgi:hypothetical protein